MNILEHTFRHLKGISTSRELELWRRGIATWDELESYLSPQQSLFGGGFSPTPILRQIDESRQALANGDVTYFCRRLERREHFRIALAFPEQTLFLDIETTGLSRYYDYITAIGWSVGAEYGFFVKSQSDKEFLEIVASVTTLVTFNGTLFDLPFIRQEFSDIQLPEVHIDLRYLSRRAGYRGGQKALEDTMNIRRVDGISGVTGETAPALWHRYRRGDNESLRTLLRYNHADISGMKPIFDNLARSLLASYSLPGVSLNVPRFANRSSADEQEILEKRIEEVVKPYSGSTAPRVTIDDISPPASGRRLKVVGIDLSGSERRASGWCVMDGHETKTSPLFGDEEIVAQTINEKPHVISIDSPLSLPAGRKSVEDSDPGRIKYGIMRDCERTLKRRGVNVYPALIKSMQKLTARGISLADTFRRLGYPVIESYPGAAQDILGIPRKRAGVDLLKQGLAEFGVSGPFVDNSVTHDELDAITSAIVGVFFWSGMYERLGPQPFGDEALIIPDLNAEIEGSKPGFTIGLSGALGAGKTTAANILKDQHGFTYGKYSQVIERMVSRRQDNYDRFDLQEQGRLVNGKYGQRWLGRRLLKEIGSSNRIAIDGVRHAEDHSFLIEVFGSKFLHIHVATPKRVRRDRILRREGRGFDFEKADSHQVEKNADVLRRLATHVVENASSIAMLENKLATICKLQGIE